MFPKWPASHSERAFLSVWFHMYFTCYEKKKMKKVSGYRTQRAVEWKDRCSTAGMPCGMRGDRNEKEAEQKKDR